MENKVANHWFEDSNLTPPNVSYSKYSCNHLHVNAPIIHHEFPIDQIDYEDTTEDLEEEENPEEFIFPEPEIPIAFIDAIEDMFDAPPLENAPDDMSFSSAIECSEGEEHGSDISVSEGESGVPEDSSLPSISEGENTSSEGVISCDQFPYSFWYHCRFLTYLIYFILPILTCFHYNRFIFLMCILQATQRILYDFIDKTCKWFNIISDSISTVYTPQYSFCYPATILSFPVS